MAGIISPNRKSQVRCNSRLRRATLQCVEMNEIIVKATWFVGGFCAVAAGVFLAMDLQMLETTMGFRMLLPMFAAAILGGIGRPFGAVVGGLVIGLAEELSVYPWFGNGSLISPGYKTGVAFTIMVIMLVIRPSGLFKGRLF